MTKTTIKTHLPTGWTIEYDASRFMEEHPYKFLLLKDGALIASGKKGKEYYGNYRNYDWEIQSHVIPEAIPIVDEIMNNYRSSIELERYIRTAEFTLSWEKKNKEANDKIEKAAREALGLTINPVVVEVAVEQENPVDEKRKSLIEKLFGWSAS